MSGVTVRLPPMAMLSQASLIGVDDGASESLN